MPKHSTRSPLATYFRSIIAAAGGTDLEQDVAAVVASCLVHGRAQAVSGDHLRRRCYDRGVSSPTHGSGGRISQGTVSRVLAMLRGKGLQWTGAHVRRWHGDEPAEPGAPRVVRHSDGYRLPARVLVLTALAVSIAIIPSAALGAHSIEHDAGRGPMQEAPPSSSESLSIEAAPSAGEIFDGERPRVVMPDELRRKLRIEDADPTRALS